MWDRAPGPCPAESEMEEGGDGQGAAAARASQVRLGFRPSLEQDLADLIFHISFSFPRRKQGLPGPPHSALHPTPPTP